MQTHFGNLTNPRINSSDNHKSVTNKPKSYMNNNSSLEKFKTKGTNYNKSIKNTNTGSVSYSNLMSSKNNIQKFTYANDNKGDLRNRSNNSSHNIGSTNLQKNPSYQRDLSQNIHSYTQNYFKKNQNTDEGNKVLPESSQLKIESEKINKLEIRQKSSLLNRMEFSPQLKKFLNSAAAEIDLDQDKLIKEEEEYDKKLKEKITSYSQSIRKGEGASANTLVRIRSILANWLKDSEQDNLEYSKFMTEKKIKYLLKNKENLDSKVRLLEGEIENIHSRKIELESSIGQTYINYELEDLESEINLFSNCKEIKENKPSKMLDQYNEMKKISPLLKEYTQLNEAVLTKTKEKDEMVKIVKSSLETLGFLSNYYKNLRKKINDLSLSK